MKKISVEAEDIEKKPTTSLLVLEYLTKTKKEVPVSHLYPVIPVAERTIRHVVSELIRKGLLTDNKKCECGATRLVRIK